MLKGESFPPMGPHALWKESFPPDPSECDIIWELACCYVGVGDDITDDTTGESEKWSNDRLKNDNLALDKWNGS